MSIKFGGILVLSPAVAPARAPACINSGSGRREEYQAADGEGGGGGGGGRKAYFKACREIRM